MKRVCAWCNKLIGIADASKTEDEIITHTICPDCANNVSFQLGVPADQLLDSLPTPVILVDSEARIITANRLARDLPGLEPEILAGRPLGNVFECAYARLPEGCGHTVHCSGCVIRRCVNQTFNTGKPMEMIPAAISHKSAKSFETSMLISTKRQASLVQLSIIWLDPGRK